MESISKVKKFVVFLAPFFVFFSAASLTQASTGKIKVCASILPQRFFIEKIGGEMVEAVIMVPPGASPATYEPRPRELRALLNSRLYFAIGVPFERQWLKRFLGINPKIKIVHTEKDIRLFPISNESSSKKGILDPHVWLAPNLVMLQARRIFMALKENYPEYSKEFEKNYASFISELVGLDLKISRILSPLKGKYVLVFHPSWGYFLRAYGLRQIAIEREGKTPKGSELVRLSRFIKEKGIKAVFFQPQFSKRYALSIGESLNLKVIELDPLAPNWEDNLLKAAKMIRDAN